MPCHAQYTHNNTLFSLLFIQRASDQEGSQEYNFFFYFYFDKIKWNNITTRVFCCSICTAYIWLDFRVAAGCFPTQHNGSCIFNGIYKRIEHIQKKRGKKTENKEKNDSVPVAAFFRSNTALLNVPKVHGTHTQRATTIKRIKELYLWTRILDCQNIII